MRERRQVKLAERQLMLARIARREAMTALAGAIDKEAHSAALAERSRQLLQGYSTRGGIVDGQALRDVTALSGGLARLVGEANAARRDAQLQAEFQADALAGTDTKLKRLEEHAHNARRTLRRLEAAREGYGSEQVAQSLLREGRTKTPPRSKPPQRTKTGTS